MSLIEKFLHRSSGQAWLDSWELPAGEFISGTTYREDCWTYGDLPGLSPEEMDEFLNAVGPENLIWLAFTKSEAFARGQYIISPMGQQKLSAHLADQKN